MIGLCVYVALHRHDHLRQSKMTCLQIPRRGSDHKSYWYLTSWKLLKQDYLSTKLEA